MNNALIEYIYSLQSIEMDFKFTMKSSLEPKPMWRLYQQLCTVFKIDYFIFNSPTTNQQPPPIPFELYRDIKNQYYTNTF